MAIQYQGEYRAGTSGAWSPLFTWQAGLTYTWNTAPLPNGTYQVQVQARDSVSLVTSAWANPITFVVSHGVTYDAEYRLVGSGTWLPLVTDTIQLSYAWDTSALANGDYEVRVRAQSAGATSNWSTVVTFTVLHVAPGGGGGQPNSIDVVNAGSIATFGRRFMQLVEDASSNIDTQAEATAMAQAALADLATPEVVQEIETLYFWPVQLNDLYSWLANGVHYDQDQDWYVASFEHVIEGGSGRTVIGVDGRPKGAYSDWLRREGVIVVDDPILGPTLVVVAEHGTVSYKVTWSGTGVITVSTDGGATWAPPATSPIIVPRPTPGSPPTVMTFQATRNEQTLTNTISIPAIGVVPDLTVVPGVLAATTLQLQPIAVDSAGGTIPVITLEYVNCTGNVAAGVVASGTVVTVNRPAFASAPALAIFRATVADGGFEEIAITIPNQDKTSFGPSFTLAQQQTKLAVLLGWSASAGTTMEYAPVDPTVGLGVFSPLPASPVNLPRAWDPFSFQLSDGLVAVRAVYCIRGTKDGVSLTQNVVVDPLPPPVIFNARVTAFNPATDSITLEWEGNLENGYGAGRYDVSLADDSSGLLTYAGQTNVTSPLTITGMGWTTKLAGSEIATAKFLIRHFHTVFGNLADGYVSHTGWV